MTRPSDAKREPGEGSRSNLSRQGSIFPDRITLVDKRLIEALVDLAIGSGAVVVHVPLDVVVVPDTALIEAVANGDPYPTGTTTIRRRDGRAASVYRMPAVTP